MSILRSARCQETMTFYARVVSVGNYYIVAQLLLNPPIQITTVILQMARLMVGSWFLHIL